MEYFVLLVFLVIGGVLLYNKPKQPISTSGQGDIKRSSGKGTKMPGGVNPNFSSMEVRNAVNQILETTAIMTSSKNIDTIQGRAEFLKERLETLEWASVTPQFKTDVQYGMDQYKTTYYNTDVHAWQVKIITDPYSFTFGLFYAKCLFNGFKKYYDGQLEEISKLKRDSAIKNRYYNLAEKLNEVKSTLSTLTDSSDVYKYRESIKPEIEEIEKSIKSNI